MVTINLETKTSSQKRLKEFLEQNASEILADKINNGVYIEKDGKRLLNKKNLDDFVKYATEQARKQAAKGETGAFVEDDTVFGWLIHYYEEDSLEGKLYNEDGTEYKPITKSKPVAKPVVTTEPKKPTPTQANLFDMLSTSSETVESETTAQAEACELVEKTAKPVDMSETIKVSPFYKHYLNIQKQYPDCIVFLRIGDFYEVFGSKAIVVAEPLNLTITSRDVGLEERVPMIGVPYHAFDNYLMKLIKENFKIAIAEDINDITVLPQYDDEEPEEMSEEEMRAFDSYVDEDADELQIGRAHV